MFKEKSADRVETRLGEKVFAKPKDTLLAFYRHEAKKKFLKVAIMRKLAESSVMRMNVPRDRKSTTKLGVGSSNVKYRVAETKLGAAR